MVEARLKYPVLLSILAAFVTLGLKAFAYLLTRSVGLLSDAAETSVNLVAAFTAYFSLIYAARPPTQAVRQQAKEQPQQRNTRGGSRRP